MTLSHRFSQKQNYFPHPVLCRLYRNTWDIDIPAHLEFGYGDEITFDFLVGFQNLADALSTPGTLTIKYEELVTKPTASIKLLLEYLEFDINDCDYKSLTSFNAKNLIASNMGDRKIFETDSIHNKSVDVWKSQLSMLHQQVICKMIGEQNIKKLGYESITLEVEKLSEEVEEHYDLVKTRMLNGFNHRNELINLTSTANQPMPNYITSYTIEILRLALLTSEHKELMKKIKESHANHVSIVDLLQQVLKIK